MSDWTITGQSGQALGASSVDIDVMDMSGGTLIFRNANADTFDFFLAATDVTADPTYLPSHLQKIAVWRSGVRQFSGVVTEVNFIWDNGRAGWSVKAEGGWSELEKYPLVTGNSTWERAQGSLKTSIEVLIDAAIAAGAQIVRGTIATMFDIIPISFRGLTFAAGLAELLKWVPDAVAWFSYTAAGLPVLNISRRPTMTEKTYALGTDEVTKCNISPVAGQTPDKVLLTYALANSNGVVSETTQTAGSGTAANQMVVISPAGLSDFNTRAAAGAVTVQTTTTANWTLAYALDPKLKDIASIPTPSAGAITYYGGSTSGAKANETWTGVTPKITGLTAPNLYAILTGEYREWMTSKLGITKGVGGFVGEFFWNWRRTTSGGGNTYPTWLQDLVAAGAEIVSNGWYNNTNSIPGESTSSVNRDTVYIFRFKCAFDLVTISRSITSATALRDPGDYPTVAPPSGLASDLLSVQGFTPWRGRIELSPHQAFARELGQKISFSGGNSRLNSIGAIAQEEQLDIQTGRRSLVVGVQSRASIATLMSRFRKTSAK